ncbi:MAG TPA: ATP-dependent helicase, partial [Rhodocyclaceae bacterium]|nr:ATP-dependent helicase [Rhodocyclaceae bacterium]
GGQQAEPRRGRRNSSIGADGFDYSKPYVPTASAGGEQSAGAPEVVASAPKRGQRPIAVLLGGLGRK